MYKSYKRYNFGVHQVERMHFDKLSAEEVERIEITNVIITLSTIGTSNSRKLKRFQESFSNFSYSLNTFELLQAKLIKMNKKNSQKYF